MLLASGLVIKLKEHNSATNTGAIYEVPVVWDFLGGPSEDPKGPPHDPDRNKPPSGAKTQRVEDPPTSGSNNREPVGDLPTKKENKKENLKLLSCEIPAPISAYLAGISASEKRRREENCLESLLQNYESSALVLAFEYVLKHGTLGKKERCHSPLRYLLSAADDVMARAKIQQPTTCINLNYSSGGPIAQSSESEDAAREEALQSFEAELSFEAQEKYLSEYAAEEFPHGFFPPSRILRRLTAMKWFQERGNSSQGGQSYAVA